MTSTAPVTDERAHVAAIRALLEPALGVDVNSPTRVFDYGTVPGADGIPGTLPTIYALVAMERRFAPVSRMVGAPTRSGWRFTVRSCGRTVSEARWAAERVTQALENQMLTVGAYVSTPVQHETTQAIQKDDLGFNGVTTFTYSL